MYNADVLEYLNHISILLQPLNEKLYYHLDDVPCVI